LGFIDRENVLLPKFITDKGYGILGNDSTIGQYKNQACFLLALGGHLMSVRQRLIQQIHELGLRTTSIIHSSAYISPTAKLGQCATVLVHSVIHTNTQIGNFCCINTGAVVEHDCQIGDNVFIQPRSVLAGGVSVGSQSVIGVGSTIREGITIGKNCIIGGGAFVCKDIPDDSVAYGVPARIINSTNSTI